MSPDRNRITRIPGGGIERPLPRARAILRKGRSVFLSRLPLPVALLALPLLFLIALVLVLFTMVLLVISVLYLSRKKPPASSAPHPLDKVLEGEYYVKEEDEFRK